MAHTPNYTISHSGNRNGTLTNIGEIKDALTIQTFEKLKAKANTFNVKFSNPRQSSGRFKYQDIFFPDDEISIKMGQGIMSGNVPVAQDLVMIGLIKSFEYDVKANGNFLIIKGDDIVTKLLDIVVVFPYPANTFTASQIVVDTINRELNSKVKPEQALNLSKVMATSKVITEAIVSDNKRIRDIIDLVSTDDRTGDGNYIYWIERDGPTTYFRWEKKPSAIDKQIDTEGEVYSFEPNKNVYNVKNFLYVNAGEDDNGNSIWTFVANFPSIADVGWKEDVLAYPTAAQEGRSLGLSGAVLINYAKSGGEAYARAILAEKNKPTWAADLLVPGTSEYNIANIVFVTSSGLGGAWNASNPNLNAVGSPYYGFKLRVNEIEQNFSEKGWQTKLSLTEDVPLQ